MAVSTVIDWPGFTPSFEGAMPAARADMYKEAPAMTIDPSKVYYATFKTDKGDIKVQRAVLGSRVFSGSSILLNDAAARLAGGEIVFWNQINTAHIGFAAGAPTRIYMGADWREAIRSHILRARLTKIEAYVEKLKAEQRELLRKSQGQMTPRHKELRESMKEHLALGKKLIETILARQKILQEALKFNPDAIVTVRAELAGDVQFLIKENTVIGDSTVSEFTVRTMAVNNTHFSKTA